MHSDVVYGVSEYSWVWSAIAVGASLIMPVMRGLWLGPGSGNANFYFNMVGCVLAMMMMMMMMMMTMMMRMMCLPCAIMLFVSSTHVAVFPCAQVVRQGHC